MFFSLVACDTTVCLVAYIYHKLLLQVGCEGPYDITCFCLQKTEVAYKLLALTVSGDRSLFYFWV